MLVIVRVDLDIPVVNSASSKRRELFEIVWLKWYQLAFPDSAFISHISVTVSPSKMSTGLTVKFVWSGKTKSNVLHYCHVNIYMVSHLVGILGALQLIHTQHLLQGTISDTRYDIFPQRILLLSLSAKDSRRFYADSQKCYHHFCFLCRKTGRRSKQVKVALWVVLVLCARPSHGSPKLWWHRRKRNRQRSM